MKTLETSVNQAIEDIRTMYYRGRFIKIELEGHLERGDRAEDCENCSGHGSYECNNDHDELTDEDGDIIHDEYEDSCEYCDNGTVECGDCNGTGRWGDDSDWGDYECEQFIMNRVSLEASDNTVYHRFDNDGSVDSEFMFTVPLTRLGLDYAIEYIKAFKLLSQEIGNGLDVKPAGMHLTILRSEDGRYPIDDGVEEEPFINFRDNMTKLMPALYLLASPDYRSRGISSFRRPGVGDGTHAHAIDVAHGGRANVLEWRVFETCYDRPEMLLDFVCTIAKGLAYFAPEVEPVKLRSNIGKLEFVDDSSKYGLHKYYQTEKHLTALKQGLKFLKPDHRTINDCLRIRNFTVTRDTLKKQKQRIAWRVESEYEDWIAKRQRDMSGWVERKVAHENDVRLAIGLKPMSNHQALATSKRYSKLYEQAYPADRLKFINRRVQECLTRHHNMFEITI